MIQDNLVSILKNHLVDLKWTSEFYTEADNTGTVYANGTDRDSRYEGRIIRPNYQVLIRTSDWDKAEYYAYEVQQLLHKRSQEEMIVTLYKSQVPVKRIYINLIYLENVGGILHLGVNQDNIREYSINFQSVIQILKEEEIING